MPRKPAKRPQPIEQLLVHFEPLEDPRVERTRLHPLENILVMALCGALCGVDTFHDLAVYAEANADWFGSFLDLEAGTPSASTFARVFAALDKESFAACFGAWVDSLATSLRGEVVAIDGKTLQRALKRASSGGPRGMHLLHVWATEQQLLLAQKAVPGAPNEPSAIPDLLTLLDLRGALVTTDANGCTTRVAGAVVAGGADYALVLKGNRGPQHAFALERFAEAERKGYEGLPRYVEEETAHGRIEVRKAWSLPAEGMPSQEEWKGLKSVTRVERERQVVGEAKGSVERVYVLSSLAPVEVQRIARAVRAHWGVENGLHWTLDVAFGEDRRAIREENGAENFALVARMALMMLKRVESKKRLSVASRRKLAGWDRAFLLRALSTGIAAD